MNNNELAHYAENLGKGILVHLKLFIMKLINKYITYFTVTPKMNIQVLI